MDGWISLHRKIIDNEVFTRPQYLRVFLYLLLMAHSGKKPIMKAGIEVKRGQYIRSLRKLQEDLIYEEDNKIKLIPLSSLRQILDFLQTKGVILLNKTGLCTLITIVKYDLYQSNETGLRTPFAHPSHNNNNGNNGINNNYYNPPPICEISEATEEEDFIKILSESSLRGNIEFKTLSVGMYKELKRVYKDNINVLEVATVFKNADGTNKLLNPRNYMLTIASRLKNKSSPNKEEVSILDGIIK